MYALGAADSFDALVYGETNPGTVAFLQSQFTQLGNTLTDAGQAFMSRGKQLFDTFNGSSAIQFARKAVQSIKGAFQTQSIVSLTNLSEFQNASITMQRWVMANPDIRQMYHLQKCDGYASSYVDVSPGQIGAEHYDYRRVMDGVMTEDESGENDYKIVHYLDELKEGDRDLIAEEQFVILRAWSELTALLALGKDDPTSDSAGQL